MNANQHEGPGKAQFERNGGSAGREAQDHVDKRGHGSKVQLHQRRFETAQLQQTGKRERGVVRQFLANVAAISWAQVTRLVSQWMEHRSFN